MPAIDALQKLQTDLIRKATNGSIFVAPYSADHPDKTTLFDTTSGDLKAGSLTDFVDMGYTDDSGAQWSNDVSTSDVSSWQSTTPTRSDITSDVDTLQVAFQETNRGTIEQYLGVDLSTVTIGTNGVLQIDKDPNPVAKFSHVLMIAVDEREDGEIVIARYLPKAQVTDRDGQNFAKGDDPIQWSVTWTGRLDDALGTAGRWYFGGAGFKARLAAMGFDS